jgi:radical SAM superfamily enzyme YgiQ (UPF0313 family)
MKNIAIVTFDIVREHEPEVAFSVASILTYLKSKKEYGDGFQVHHVPVNLFHKPQQKIDWSSITNFDWCQMDFVAVSCYVWSHHQSVSVMKWLKENKVKAKIIAGGYQINVTNTKLLRSLYPDADHYILGYAEQALYNILTTEHSTEVIQASVDFSQIPSPFTTGIIALNSNTTRIRLETKRGCPFACTFCAQHELDQRKVNYYLDKRLLPELEYIRQFSPERVSVTDPVFNMGNSYIPYLENVYRLGLKGIFNFQVRPEIIARRKDSSFLDLIAETDSQIELGIQTFDQEINTAIMRKNNYTDIDYTLRALLDREIKFGISLIYGLPGQTLDSFKRDIEKVTSMGIKMWLLILYPYCPGLNSIIRNTRSITQK